MNVQIPVKWLQELLALCGPEDHELRERVMVSITAMDEQAAQVEEIQWRNIKKVVDALADLCFGSVNDPKWGIAHVAIRHSLVSKDGLDITALGLEPLSTAPKAQADARDAIRELIAKHRAELEHNDYAYFELAYTRRTGWMAWITDKPLIGGPVINPDRKVLARGQGDTPEEACAAAIAAQQGGTA